MPADDLVEDGDASALDRLGGLPGDGLTLLPAHPWQLELLGGTGLRPVGVTAAAVATASIRTVYLPEADLFCKFSLDVRITNDVRRLWLHDLRRLSLVAALVDVAFDDLPRHLPRPAVLRDRGWRSARLGGDGGEALAVIVRDGLGEHLLPGLTALLAAGISEGFPGNPLDALDEDGALVWWERYLEHVVPPVLHAYLRHGVVLECHLQNVLIAVDEHGMPGQALFRDHEGIKLVAERHPGLGAPVLGGVRAWERLVYCLLTNNLCEIAGAVTARHPRLRDELWARARAAFAAAAKEYGDPPELRDLLAAAHIPAKANLLLRWLDADGAAMRWVPIPNPLRLFTPRGAPGARAAARGPSRDGPRAATAKRPPPCRTARGRPAAPAARPCRAGAAGPARARSPPRRRPRPAARRPAPPTAAGVPPVAGSRRTRRRPPRTPSARSPPRQAAARRGRRGRPWARCARSRTPAGCSAPCRARW
ncbi:IucA/IucC family C-terminal-domain containing protein [Nonomuraea rubra]|uniref:IucA/IucC family C-terminal-domain containing protein n=1 Tax=Nonomuraea rubra TaxID=46180 RepID=UPI00361D6C14